MTTTKLSLNHAHDLSFDTLKANGCDDANAAAVADTIVAAERDLCHSHGLFRLPGYVASLKSGKVNGSAKPQVEVLAPAVLRVDGDNGYAPLALQAGRDAFAACTKQNGIAALSLIKIHHFAALWIEVEALAEQGLCGFAFTAYTPAVAPPGGKEPFYGTNPMAFGWPRENKPPMVFDQASAAKAKGEVMIAAREGHTLAPGVGIDADGNPTTDPNEVLKGSLLPFGGYKGASIALMIELLVGPLIGERASFEAAAADNKDGGPPRGGELMIAIDPTRFGHSGSPFDHAEKVFQALLAQEGTRLPGERRHLVRARAINEGIEVPTALYDKIISLS